MLKRYSYFLPDITESWFLIGVLAIGGSILGALVTMLINVIFPGFFGWGELITYPLIFIPPAALIYFSVRSDERISLLKGDSNRVSVKINSPNFGSIGALLSFIMILPLVFAFNLVTEPLSMWMEVPQFFKDLMLQIQTNKLSSFLAIVIFAPLLEEIFCRGIILRGLLHHTTPAKAIIWSAVMFGVMHLNPWQALPAFLLGLLMGWIYWRTRSLWIVIFIHFINNGFSYLITILFPEIPVDFGFADFIPGNYYYLIYILALIYTVGVIFYMDKLYGKIIPSQI
ncbi:MAG: type II CAAX endopeptidase family protein [Bacteroidales bacterium]|nr:type II CAAX endopeptidase family protein [Bacteroidales bacterium]